MTRPVGAPQPLDQFFREKHHSFFQYNGRVYTYVGVLGTTPEGVQYSVFAVGQKDTGAPEHSLVLYGSAMVTPVVMLEGDKTLRLVLR